MVLFEAVLNVTDSKSGFKQEAGCARHSEGIVTLAVSSEWLAQAARTGCSGFLCAPRIRN